MFSEFEYGKFFRVSNVYGAGEVIAGGHHFCHAHDQVVDVLEATCLLSGAIDGDIFSLKSLYDEVGYDSSVAWVHIWAVGVEYAYNFYFYAILSVVVGKDGFSTSFPFVVTGTYADGVYISPIAFGLGVYLWVAVDFAG